VVNTGIMVDQELVMGPMGLAIRILASEIMNL
jgi:hypothetical protein